MSDLALAQPNAVITTAVVSPSRTERPLADADHTAGPILWAEPVAETVCGSDDMLANIDSIDQLLSATLAPAVPTISVVMPAGMNAQRLTERVAELQTAAADIEIVLVAEHAEEPMANVLRELQDASGVQVVHRQRSRRRSSALTLGSEHATGLIVMWLGTETIRPADFDALVAPILKGCCGAVWGVDANHVTRKRRSAQTIISRLRQRLDRSSTALESGCFAVRRDLLNRVGPTGRHLSPSEVAAWLAHHGEAVYEMPVSGA